MIRLILGAIALLAMALAAMSAPPAIEIPPEIKGDTSAFVVVKAEAKASTWIRYVPLDSGLSVFPSQLLADTTVTVVVASKPGRYRVLAYTGNDEGGAEAVTTLVIGEAIAPPQVDPIKPVEPTKPIGDSKIYIVVIRPDGPVSKDFLEVMTSTAWDDHRKAGRVVKSYPLGETVDKYPIPSGTTLPTVLVLKATGSKSEIVGPPVPLPTTPEGIRKLGEGVK